MRKQSLFIFSLDAVLLFVPWYTWCIYEHVNIQIILFSVTYCLWTLVVYMSCFKMYQLCNLPVRIPLKSLVYTNMHYKQKVVWEDHVRAAITVAAKVFRCFCINFL